MQPLDRSGHLHVVIYRLDFLAGVIPLDLGRLETYGIACLNQRGSWIREGSCIPSSLGRSGGRWADLKHDVGGSSWWNLVSGEASASVKASFIQLDPPVDGSARLVLFLGADQLDDPPGTPIPLYGSL